MWIDGANHNSLVGCKFVNNPFVYYNVVSGNKQNGLRVTDANDTVVQGNFFGTGANNTAIVKNRLQRHPRRRVLGGHPGGRRDPAGQRVRRQRPQRDRGDRHG